VLVPIVKLRQIFRVGECDHKTIGFIIFDCQLAPLLPVLLLQTKNCASFF